MKDIINKPKVCSMGLGYIGLPTAALMAGRGLEVCGVDTNPHVVETINKGGIHIVEPDLSGLVEFAVRKGLLTASTKPVPADVFIIAVPTPFKSEGGDGHGHIVEKDGVIQTPIPDVSYVQAAIEAIIPFIQPGNLVIIESTSPVKTTEQMADIIFKKRSELKGKIFIAYCPERVLPGQVIYELEHNDRVIGGIDQKSAEKAEEFYSLFVRGNLYKTNSRTAEMCKLVENSYRDVNIAFANELSMITDRVGIDVRELISLANRHPRVNILQPGPGVGGHCIAVDPWFIVADFEKEAEIIRRARVVNINKSKWVIGKIKDAAAEFEKKNSKKPVIACMGLAYKPDIDDLRESPAVDITRHLVDDGFSVRVVEPNVQKHKDFEIVETQEAFDRSDIVVFLVSHKEFRQFKGQKKNMLDFCGVVS
jgi:UDP-N-acetyl-D-mannosaminuronic acid dehydrogenase